MAAHGTVLPGNSWSREIKHLPFSTRRHRTTASASAVGVFSVEKSECRCPLLFKWVTGNQLNPFASRPEPGTPRVLCHHSREAHWFALPQKEKSMSIPSSNEFERGYRAFQKHERRDSMYKVATFLVEHFWGNPGEMADGLGVLLLTWNQALFRYGSFDFDELEKCIASNLDLLAGYRTRIIFSYSLADDQAITALFQQFLLALRICEGGKAGAKSPVAVAKALHLLAPDFFPLWDDKIARAYQCKYSSSSQPAKKYLKFMDEIRQIAQALQSFKPRETGKTLLKLIDEYNYAKYTKDWV